MPSPPKPKHYGLTASVLNSLLCAINCLLAFSISQTIGSMCKCYGGVLASICRHLDEQGCDMKVCGPTRHWCLGKASRGMS